MREANHRTGGRILVDQLQRHGVTAAFCVPGESYLHALDALHDADGLRLVTCRMEAGAANMAAAWGKLTGQPGICFVTRGPGAAHAAVGVHTARQDSVPMILFVGQVARGMRGREAFQEMDFAHVFGTLAKWTVEVDDPARLPELVARAFSVAMSGRPGPVVVSLPEDMLAERAAAADARPARPARPRATAEDLAALGARLRSAERPLAIVGGVTWTARAAADLARFAEAQALPVAAAFRSQDLLHNDHPLYVGDLGLGVDPRLAERVRRADLVLALGTRLEEIVSQGYTLFGIPVPEQRLVHVFPDAEEIDRVVQSDLGIVSDMEAFCAGAAALPPASDPPWTDWAQAARADFEAIRVPPPASGAVDMAAIVRHLSDTLPEDAIIANGAGNYTAWVHKFFTYKRPGTQLAPTSGAMGYGVPAAIAAKVAEPGRLVVSVNGDGCFLMCGQELATAVQHGLDPVFLIVNNASYGTIRMHQERAFPGRVVGTDLANPDFVALARAYGAHAERVRATEEFAPAFERARAAGRAAVIEIVQDVEQIAPRRTLSAIRDAARQRP